MEGWKMLEASWHRLYLLRFLQISSKVHEKALTEVLSSLPEESMTRLRQEFFLHFFYLAPSGQDFFKQSLTRLYFIADSRLDFQGSFVFTLNSKPTLVLV